MIVLQHSKLCLMVGFLGGKGTAKDLVWGEADMIFGCGSSLMLEERKEERRE